VIVKNPGIKKMNRLVNQYFLEENRFEKVIFLADSLDLDWSAVTEIISDFPRGWFELSRISVQDRIQFTYDFWLDRLPFHINMSSVLNQFFGKLEDVGVVLICNEGLWSCELIYSLKDNSSFFRGCPGASSPDIEEVKMSLGFSLPRDYFAFMKIHNGFGRRSEMGLLKLDELVDARRRLSQSILKADRIVKSGSTSVDPGALLPFYEVYGLASFQCFYTDWYPGNEPGNVYFSGVDYTVSDTRREKFWNENLAFSSFLEWFIYYLEGMSISS